MPLSLYVGRLLQQYSLSPLSMLLVQTPCYAQGAVSEWQAAVKILAVLKLHQPPNSRRALLLTKSCCVGTSMPYCHQAAGQPRSNAAFNVAWCQSFALMMPVRYYRLCCYKLYKPHCANTCLHSQPFINDASILYTGLGCWWYDYTH